ncbi:hypothetical protein JTM37_34995, partial [Pseudomonas aeruginosa]|nr:hypothetical protein [Pseudomonas aeruginosa]
MSIVLHLFCELFDGLLVGKCQMQLFTFANCGAGYDAGLREFDLLGRDRNGLSRQRVLAIGSFGVLGVIRPNAQVCIEEVELLGNLIDETRIAVVVLGAIDAG